MPLDYSTYLKIDDLLALQEPRSDGPEHDEMLFIVIHQVYELWFKQILHEAGRAQSALEQGDANSAGFTLKRILTILKTLVAQVDVLETMTPVQFTSFRDRLEQGSGFQSRQFREFELALGHRAGRDLSFLTDKDRQQVEAIYQQRSLYDSFLRYLKARGLDVPDELLNRDLSQPNPSSEAVQDILVKIYREDPEACRICEQLVDLDEGLQEWRYRHVKMVERTIGTKTGTGGSSGAEYLRSTLFRPLFPDLWAIRSRL